MLNCRHCMGHYLKQMPNVDTPEKLKAFALNLEKKGGLGMLISGGCTPQGKVPLEKFFPSILWIKENTNLLLNLHTGLINQVEAEKIVNSKVDYISVDVVGDNKTILNVYGLKNSVKDYLNTLQNLRDSGAKNVIPHICIGLDYGKILGEYEAVKIATSINPETIVFISLIPTEGTEMQNVTPPLKEDILKIISFTKKIDPNIELSIGCMRTKKGKSIFEKETINQGITRMTMPSKSTVEYVKDKGYKILHLEGCCATPASLEKNLIKSVT
ncbi:radical SAM protein [Candidatus Bathyarchaeota archaeon]|nr:radical SAM protein [Candidatus Bathyarchaeota archaeon]